jgi:hypothetical protein
MKTRYLILFTSLAVAAIAISAVVIAADSTPEAQINQTWTQIDAKAYGSISLQRIPNELPGKIAIVTGTDSYSGLVTQGKRISKTCISGTTFPQTGNRTKPIQLTKCEAGKVSIYLLRIGPTHTKIELSYNISENE